LQSEAQFNLQSLGDNKTGYHAENINFFPQMKTSRKVHICLHWLFKSSWKCTAMQSNASSLPIIYNFHVMLLLLNITFPSEIRQ